MPLHAHVRAGFIIKCFFWPGKVIYKTQTRHILSQ